MLARYAEAGAARGGAGLLAPALTAPFLLSWQPATAQRMQKALEAVGALPPAPPPAGAGAALQRLPSIPLALAATAPMDVAARGRPCLSAAVALTEAAAALLLLDRSRAATTAPSAWSAAWAAFLRRCHGWYRPEFVFAAALGAAQEGGGEGSSRNAALAVEAASLLCDALGDTRPEEGYAAMALHLRLWGLGRGSARGVEAAAGAVACVAQAVACRAQMAGPGRRRTSCASAGAGLVGVLLQWWATAGAEQLGLCEGAALAVLHTALSTPPLAQHVCGALLPPRTRGLSSGAAAVPAAAVAPLLPLGQLERLNLPPRVLLAAAAGVLGCKNT